MLQTLAEAHAIEQGTRTRLQRRRRGTQKALRQQHVLEHGQARQQVERLEHEADAAIAEIAGAFVIERRHVGAVERIAARGGAIEAAEDIEKCRFAGTRWPDNREELPLRHLDVDAG
jgi:hypothetical protein